MLYAKLTLRNIKRSMKEYSLFMFTMIMSMTLVYTFFAVFHSDRILQISVYMQKFSDNLLPMLGVMIMLILSWLINYVVNCIFRKRSREFGLYLLSGMKRHSVMLMFLSEQLLLGLFALLAGLLLGGILSQVMEYVIVQIFSLEYEFQLMWNQSGVLGTLLVFVLLYAVEMLKEGRMISKAKIHDLLYLSSKNEVTHPTKRKSLFYFILALIFMIAGYTIIYRFQQVLYDPDIRVNATSLMLAVLMIFGSVYLFYMSLSDILVMTLQKCKTRKYKGNLMFLNGQLCARMRSNRFVLASLSVLIITIICGLSFSFVFKTITDVRVKEQVPFDILAISSDGVDENGLASYLQQKQIPYQLEKIDFYRFPPADMQETLAEGLRLTRAYYPGLQSVFLKESEAERLATLSGIPLPKPLQKGEYAVIVTSDLVGTMEEYAKQTTVSYQGETLSLAYISKDNLMPTLYMEYFVILPDAYFTNAAILQEGVFANLEQPTTRQMEQDLEHIVHDTDGYRLLRVKNAFVQDQLSMFLMTISTAIYLSLIAICICATMIATQQFSDMKEQQETYQLLSKLGLSKRQRRRLLFKQVIGYFLIPMLLPCIYLPLLMSLGDTLITASAGVSLVPSVCISILIFLVIYGCYFLMAYLGCKRNIEQGEVSSCSI